jgi:sugar lactone lactonase YvrE
VLQDNGGNSLPVPANASFVFTTALASGAAYSVTVSTQPANPSQNCIVMNGSGTVTNVTVSTVVVTCLTTTSALIVADYANSRVLIYNAPFVTGQSANVVLGQSNFTTATIGTTASTMNQPLSTAEDNAGNLYVADNLNCRVIQFQPPFSNGMSANVVFGQPNLNTGNCPVGISPSTLGNNSSMNGDEVLAVTFDSSGALWVADSGSNRVLKYQPPFSDGMAATLAIGQPDLTSDSPNQGGASATSSSLSDPGFCVFDSSGNIWIPDLANNRLLEFKPPFATGMVASLVLGQADFTHNSDNQGGAVGANTLSDAVGTAFDSSGNLWVADSVNNRVLEFQPPFTTNNMAATLVLGQADFTNNMANQGGPPSMATLSFPTQVMFDSSGRLFVADFTNNRTLVFAPPFITGMNASLVIGQGNFASPTPATSAVGQSGPNGVTAEPPL